MILTKKGDLLISSTKHRLFHLADKLLTFVPLIFGMLDIHPCQASGSAAYSLGNTLAVKVSHASIYFETHV